MDVFTGSAADSGGLGSNTYSQFIYITHLKMHFTVKLEKILKAVRRHSRSTGGDGWLRGSEQVCTGTWTQPGSDLITSIMSDLTGAVVARCS